MAHAKAVRLGTRSSALARRQAEWVAAQLEHSGVAVQLISIETHGDLQPSGSIDAIGAQGVFTKSIQQALLAGEIDLTVHSLKDLPTEPVEGIQLAAVPEREEVSDALVSRRDQLINELPPGGKVGTGSLRRRAQLLHARPDLTMADIRGNVDTRLRKLDQGQYDAIVLAMAGLNRLGLKARVSEILSLSTMLPAVGQGALGIETRCDDQGTQAAISPLDHAPSRKAVTAERTLLAALRGGCQAPVGAWGRIEQDRLCLSAVVLSHDGVQRAEYSASADPKEAIPLGHQVAEALIERGASQLIEAARTER